jgi:hypothetical protein
MRNQILTPDRLRELRGSNLAYYLKHFDTFVERFEAHLTFATSLTPSAVQDLTISAENRSIPSFKPKPPSAKTPHTRVTSAQTALLSPDVNCLSCHKSGYEVLKVILGPMVIARRIFARLHICPDSVTTGTM